MNSELSSAWWRERPLVVLRDDDVNSTTPVDRLARVYRPLLEDGHKIVFSVIPNVSTTVRAPDGERERFVVGADLPDYLPFAPDSELAEWLGRLGEQAELALHGYTHERLRGGTEFGALSEEEAGHRLDRALALMHKGFQRTPESFVAPWDAFSRGSLAAVCKRFRLVSTCYVDRTILPPRSWGIHGLERLRRVLALPHASSWILRHQGGMGPDSTSTPEPVISIGAAPVQVIPLHHWMYWDRDPHERVVSLARALRGTRTVTFHEAARLLSDLGFTRWLRMCLFGPRSSDRRGMAGP